METLQGKVAVVTGAASGIGRALAERFAADGMRLVLADVEQGPLEELRAALAGAGTEAIAVATDVSDNDAVLRLRDETVAAFGTAHVVCNNAGVGAGGPMEQTPIESWRWTLGVNLWGVIHGVSAFLPLLLAQGEGHIVNTASVAGLLSFPQMGPYNVSKYGVVALSETLYQELIQADSPVGVTALCPGFVATKIMESDRNRPAELTPEPPSQLQGDEAAAELEALRALARDAYRTQLAPAAVAELVRNAILERRLYCFTDDKFVDLLRVRADALLSATNLPAFGTLFDRLLG